MTNVTTRVPVQLPNDAIAYVEVATQTGEEDVSFERISFESVAKAIEGIAGTLYAALQKANPTKASIELGIEIGVEAGQLTALIVKGEGKANLKVQLEWEKKTG